MTYLSRAIGRDKRNLELLGAVSMDVMSSLNMEQVGTQERLVGGESGEPAKV